MNNDYVFNVGRVALGYNAPAVHNDPIQIGYTGSESVECIAIGVNASAIGYRSVAIGKDARAKHDKSLVIGNCESNVENGINIADKLLVNENELIVGGHRFISGELKINNEITIKGNVNCDACLTRENHGFEWNENSSGVCLNCIRDTVMFFKAKERFEENVKNL